MSIDKNFKSMKYAITFKYVFMILLMFIVFLTVFYINTSKQFAELQEVMLVDTISGASKVTDYYITENYGQLEAKDGDLLDKDGKSIKGDNKVVDKIKEQLNINVSIYVKEGNQFKVVTSNEVNENGKKIIDEYLDETSLVYEKLINGQSYVGHYTSNNIEYNSKFSVLEDSRGDVIGAIYLGTPESKSDEIINTYIYANLKESGIFAAVLMILFLIFSFLLSNNIIKPIKKLTILAEKIADLDVRNRVSDDILKRKDEIGILGKSFNNVNIAISSILKDVYNNANEIREDASFIRESVSNIAISNEEVSKTINEISKAAFSQAEDSQTTTYSMDKLNDVILEGFSTATKLNTSTDSMKKLKNEGIVLVNELTNKTSDNLIGIQSVKTIIEDTKVSSNKIKKATEMIRGISKQTNLIAINASIEASKAGKFGESFTIVANEIKVLADNSKEFSDEIATVMEELVKKVTDSIEVIQKFESAIINQSNSVNDTKSKFEGIALSIGEIEPLIEILNNNNKVINEKRSEVSSIISNLSAIAEENAAGTEEVTASIEDQNSSLKKISNLGFKLEKMVDSLNDKISQFKYE